MYNPQNIKLVNCGNMVGFYGDAVECQNLVNWLYNRGAINLDAPTETGINSAQFYARRDRMITALAFDLLSDCHASLSQSLPHHPNRVQRQACFRAAQVAARNQVETWLAGFSQGVALPTVQADLSWTMRWAGFSDAKSTPTLNYPTARAD